MLSVVIEQEQIPSSDGRNGLAGWFVDGRDDAGRIYSWACGWLGVIGCLAAADATIATATVTAVMMAAIILRMVIVKVVIVTGVIAGVLITAPRFGFIDVHLNEW